MQTTLNRKYDTQHYYHDGYCLSPFTIFIYRGMLYVRNFVGIPNWHDSHSEHSDVRKRYANKMKARLDPPAKTQAQKDLEETIDTIYANDQVQVLPMDKIEEGLERKYVMNTRNVLDHHGRYVYTTLYNPADTDVWNEHLLDEDEYHAWANLKPDTPVTNTLVDDEKSYYNPGVHQSRGLDNRWSILNLLGLSQSTFPPPNGTNDSNATNGTWIDHNPFKVKASLWADVTHTHAYGGGDTGAGASDLFAYDDVVVPLTINGTQQFDENGTALTTTQQVWRVDQNFSDAMLAALENATDIFAGHNLTYPLNVTIVDITEFFTQPGMLPGENATRYAKVEFQVGLPSYNLSMDMVNFLKIKTNASNVNSPVTPWFYSQSLFEIDTKTALFDTLDLNPSLGNYSVDTIVSMGGYLDVASIPNDTNTSNTTTTSTTTFIVDPEVQKVLDRAKMKNRHYTYVSNNVDFNLTQFLMTHFPSDEPNTALNQPDPNIGTENFTLSDLKKPAYNRRNIHVTFTYNLEKNETQFWINGRYAFSTPFDVPLYNVQTYPTAVEPRDWIEVNWTQYNNSFGPLNESDYNMTVADPEFNGTVFYLSKTTTTTTATIHYDNG
jgi:hypothetical protein